MVLGMAIAQTTDQTQTTTVTTQTTAVQPQQNGMVVTIMKNNNLSWEDAAATVALARALNMDPQLIVTQRTSYPNVSVYDLAPGFVIAQESGKPFSDVYSMYTGGQTWLQISNNLNVPVAYWNPANVTTTSWTNDDYSNGVWQAILEKNYGMSPDDVVYFTTKKMPMNEVIVGEVVSRDDNTPIRDVMNAYNGNRDWSAIDQQFALNQNNPMNQSQVTNTQATLPTVNPNTPVVNQTTTTNTTTIQPQPVQTAPVTNTENQPIGNGETSNAGVNQSGATNGNHVTSAMVSPIEEWQVNGASINAYNGWTNTASTSSTYALHRHHRRHHRMRRHYRRHHIVHHHRM